MVEATNLECLFGAILFLTLETGIFITQRRNSEAEQAAQSTQPRSSFTEQGE